jgi:ankyrin repeat protein
MDLPLPPESSSSPSPFGLVSVCGLLTELEDVGRVVALVGYGYEARRLPFLCTCLARDEELLAATRDAVYGGLGRTRLMYAARVGAIRRVQVLLRPREVNVDAEDSEGRTALIHACAAGQTESARRLLDAGADVDKEDTLSPSYEGLWRPLHFASAMGQAGVVRLFLSRGVQPDQSWDRDEQSQPLYVACEYGHVEVVRLLLDAWADETKTNENGCTPFICAVLSGQLHVVRLLLDRGQDVDGRTANGGFIWSSLYMADHLSMAELLLERGAGVNVRDGLGSTPLHGAAHGGNVALTRLFLDRGADPEAVDSGGRTPLQRAYMELALIHPTIFNQPRRQRYLDVIEILEAATAATAAP